MTEHWEVQEAVDWVENAFGEIEDEVARWRPLAWLRALLAAMPRPAAFRAG
ncbi:hypothetical protein KAJ83_16570 [Marivibrio halodurans]|uniref:Uncharacterized protein n=1 Tax=Marivibrio halodurans TaxID=2039722 RepID=A0A8J7SPX4_9PROT|nr:hypothetical protein [Marivibrio halodurans]MBP5858636.1 hypothetical protein [Marivibrio halodurans]